MEAIRVVLFLIVALVGLLVAVTIFTGGIQQGRGTFPTGPVQVRLLSQPSIDRTSADFCTTPPFSGANPSCTIPLRLYDMRVKSEYVGDVAVVVSYAGQEWLVPCGRAPNKRGPCALTGAETSIDLEVDLNDFVSAEEGRLNPPTLNLSGAGSFKNWVWHEQHIILDNYDIFARTVAVSAGFGLVEIINKAFVTVTCNQPGILGREFKVLTLKKGESSTQIMCGGTVDIKVEDIRSSQKQSCLNINVGGGTEWSGEGDSVKVTFWKFTPQFRGEQDLKPCGGVAPEFLQDLQYFDKFKFSTNKALSDQKCVESFMGSFEFTTQVLPYDSVASPWKLEAC